ncbi:MAG: hypothetical protein A2817_03320 [Candidatus Yanofskybacteria bacterium RIFCSPHIGHO2_01_FULL_39_8b]|uniref:Uncharacterized protein n=1 Tax=Candidatus Yanofskybacteria bacterium RIFCSPHIGHO2_01_FULL_39_8b TaxID=1802659 RepID=A0A1F8EEX0_9BACT|nr:MAG: hypothetical protein A2817_03320 [Candidatus Yanofskybacteria bacterium RIFCSPHIGHO2_01_FULL_39_8b]
MSTLKIPLNQDNHDLLNPNEAKIREMIAEKLKKSVKTPCQRILLIHPMHIKEENFYLDRALGGRYWSYQPYGCGILCRNLDRRGYETDILDLNFEMLSEAHRLDHQFSYMFWQESLLNKLDRFKPDLVGISCMFSMSHKVIKDIAKKIKQAYPITTIIVGGVHPSNASHLVLEDCADIDFLGPHEGDRSFPDLIDFINGKLPVQSLAQIGTIIQDRYVTPTSQTSPGVKEIESSPLYHSLPIGEYNDLGQIGSYGFLRKGRKAASVLSNRGCRAHCSFCSVPDFNGPGVRGRSAENVLDEIEELHHRYGIQHITWLDDDLLFDKNRALKLFNGIKSRNLDITWDASNGLIAAFVTPDIMKAIAESGCLGFNLGIESGTPEILRAVHKPGTLESFRKAKKVIDDYPHIFVRGFLMLGFPNETFGQILNTINFCIELDLDWYAIQILNLLPATDIYKNLLEQGLIEENLQTSDIAYVFGPSSPQRKKEQKEKNQAKDFYNLFETCDLNSIPSKDQLMDCSFVMDFKVNYWKVKNMTDPIKLGKAKAILTDISNRIAPENPLAHLFLAFAEQKLGNIQEAKHRAGIASQIVLGSDTDSGSAYWRKRFESFDLYDTLNFLLKL